MSDLFTVTQQQQHAVTNNSNRYSVKPTNNENETLSLKETFGIILNC